MNWNNSIALKYLCAVGVGAALAVFALKSTVVGEGLYLQAIDSEYTQYMASFGRSYKTKNEFAVRRDLYSLRKREIGNFNAGK
jgi:hypothetical protein